MPENKCSVYVVGWREKGPLKVGIALDPVARLGDLQVACPYRLRIYKAFWLPDPDAARLIEDAALEVLSPDAMQGEWVNAPASIVSRVVIRAIERTKFPVMPWRAEERERATRQATLERDARKAAKRAGQNAVTELDHWRKN